MRLRRCAAILAAALALLAACGAEPAARAEESAAAKESGAAAAGEETLPEGGAATEEDEQVRTIEIECGGSVFTAELAGSAAAGELEAMLPLSLDMSELNGNEKYCYLDTSMTTEAARPGRIEAGDLMLFGDSCVVLFYESFSTSYSYTPLGRVLDAEGLAAALGGGGARVTFRAAEG